MKWFAFLLVLVVAAPAHAELRLLRFASDSCPYCRQMEKVWATIDSGLDESDVDTGERRDLVRQLGINTVPTAVLLETKDGKSREVRRLVGLKTRAQVLEFLPPKEPSP